MEVRALRNCLAGNFREEPACRGGVLPDAASDHDPDTLASYARHSDFSREGV